MIEPGFDVNHIKNRFLCIFNDCTDVVILTQCCPNMNWPAFCDTMWYANKYYFKYQIY